MRPHIEFVGALQDSGFGLVPVGARAGGLGLGFRGVWDMGLGLEGLGLVLEGLGPGSLGSGT